MRIQQGVKLKDRYVCRLCGDWKDKVYLETGTVVEDIHAHHIYYPGKILREPW